jgi:type II secretory pathway pseudopilin PulG
MRTQSSEAGFTLAELLIATTISLVVIGTAMTTFKDAVAMTGTASYMADTSLNLRAGINLLIRDLESTGRGIPTGGIPIPSGANAGAVNRPSPPGLAYTFDNINATTISAVTTGSALGPSIDNQTTDMVTVLAVDPLLDEVLVPANAPAGSQVPLLLSPAGTPGNVDIMAADGSSFTLNPSKAWLAGNTTNSIPPVNKGDLLLFVNTAGQYAIQTVTRVDTTHAYFDSNSDDPFSFNQRNAAAGSIVQILGTALTVRRVVMYTYFVDPSNGTPRLMRQYNFGTPQALAGVVEDLQLQYDIVDGSVNPTSIDNLPYTANGVTYSANQIRKVSVHIGVRSETMALKPRDYLRTHLSTVVSLRQLAYVDRYK